MTRGPEFTLRPKIPAATPAINPLNVEPKMIPTICARTAGVNQADPPSIAPSTAPSKSPSNTLFIAFLRGVLSLLFLTTDPQNPLGLSMHEKQNKDTHRQVGCNQQDKEAIAAVESAGVFQKALTTHRRPPPTPTTSKNPSAFLEFVVALVTV